MSRTNFDRYLEAQLQDPVFAERFEQAGEIWDVALQFAALGIGLLLSVGAASAQPPPNDLDAAIRQHRKGLLVIETSPGTEVVVEQQRHEFWFGAALANQVFSGRMGAEDRDKYLSLFLTNFNCAVTENALKWHDMEPRRGSVNYATVDAFFGQYRIKAGPEEKVVTLKKATWRQVVAFQPSR